MFEEYNLKEIAPFEDTEFRDKMSKLVEEPGFEHAVRWVMPDVDYKEFVKELLNVPDKNTLQTKVMGPFLELLASKTTDGITYDGIENVSDDHASTFITNHRDIVLDASFLNLCFLRNNKPTSEIAIGDNLLIYEWISDLVKINKSFIVKRNLKMTQALKAAMQLSAYIHYAIMHKHESVWIAQREGRAKDSNDVTQESLMKMLALEGKGSTARNLEMIHLTPVSISYEYDPNDYLKAKEFLLKERDPEYKKSQHDDLLSMETGLLQYKGRVHFSISKDLSPLIASIPDSAKRLDVIQQACHMVDNAIHLGYKIYPINYIAADLLKENTRYAANYTPVECAAFKDYIEKQIDRIDVPDLTFGDRQFLRKKMFEMYANPLYNKLAAQQKSLS